MKSLSLTFFILFSILAFSQNVEKFTDSDTYLFTEWVGNVVIMNGTEAPDNSMARAFSMKIDKDGTYELGNSFTGSTKQGKWSFDSENKRINMEQENELKAVLQSISSEKIEMKIMPNPKFKQAPSLLIYLIPKAQ